MTLEQIDTINMDILRKEPTPKISLSELKAAAVGVKYLNGLDRDHYWDDPVTINGRTYSNRAEFLKNYRHLGSYERLKGEYKTIGKKKK